MKPEFIQRPELPEPDRVLVGVINALVAMLGTIALALVLWSLL